MYKTIISLCFALTALVGLCLGDNINTCIDESSCPQNTSLKCCCETYMTTYFAVTKKASYWEATVSCHQAGMDLATITTPEESNTLTEYLKSVNSAVAASEGFWIGAFRWVEATDFYWLKTGEPLIFSDFFPGEPNNATGNEYCIQWVKGEATNATGWNDLNCDARINFVCQSRSKCI